MAPQSFGLSITTPNQNQIFKYQHRQLCIMNLDLAITNAIRRGPMESAMHSVVSNYGQSYELHAIPQTIKKAEEMFGQKIAMVSHTSFDRVSTIPWASEVSFATNNIPSTAPFNAMGAWDSQRVTPFDSPSISTQSIPNLFSLDNKGNKVMNNIFK